MVEIRKFGKMVIIMNILMKLIAQLKKIFMEFVKLLMNVLKKDIVKKEYVKEILNVIPTILIMEVFILKILILEFQRCYFSYYCFFFYHFFDNYHNFYYLLNEKKITKRKRK